MGPPPSQTHKHTHAPRTHAQVTTLLSKADEAPAAPPPSPAELDQLRGAAAAAGEAVRSAKAAAAANKGDSALAAAVKAEVRESAWLGWAGEGWRARGRLVKPPRAWGWVLRGAPRNTHPPPHTLSTTLRSRGNR